MKADIVIDLAKKYIGSTYILGAYVPKSSPSYRGAFDCAEFIAYVNFQVFGILYGTELNNFSRKNADDAYTGYFGRDAEKKGMIIPVDQAIRTIGAMLLRLAKGSAVGHIVFSQGDGKTVEAHSSKYGVIESKTDGRRWDIGILLPDVEYTENIKVESKAPATVYRLKSPNMSSAFVGEIQRILGLTVDNIYGIKTQAAVVKFQRSRGLVADGEVMPNGETARALGIK